VDITAEVAAVVAAAGVSRGICHVFVPHTTCGITLNERADPSVRDDMLAALARIVPADAGYRHAEGNSDAHLQASLVGHAVTIPIRETRLSLGVWQALFLCEFDGPRAREVVVTVLPV